MFSKAKRFEPIVPGKNQIKKQENEKPKVITKPPLSATKAKPLATPKGPSAKTNHDAQSQCSSVHSVKSFATPKPIKSSIATKLPTSLKKRSEVNFPKNKTETHTELIKAQEVEIRNKDHTISEYTKQIEEFKSKVSQLEKQLEEMTQYSCNKLGKQFSQITLEDGTQEHDSVVEINGNYTVKELKDKIDDLEKQCEKLEQEVTDKQLALRSVEEVITIRDSLCQDLQQKLTNAETDLDETRQRLEMVKGHHALALEANESIRREYKVELESLKTKLEEEKQAIMIKSKTDQENIKLNYKSVIEAIKNQLVKEKYEAVQELQQELINKDNEIKAKIEQIDEATREKLRLCEIQFEERSRNIHDLYTQQQKTIQYLENEIKDLKYKITMAEEEKMILQKELNNIKNDNISLNNEKFALIKERDDIKEEPKRKLIDFENEINKLTVEVDKAVKEKTKFETSLSVTRDIVQVLTMRLRESDNELEHLEDQIQTLTNSKEILENELANYKSTLNNTAMECNEYKEALVNILKSKAALAKEHTRIMEHNVSLIESLQNVEKEAYRELGSIKNELIEDVELLKKESSSQIYLLREEVEKKRKLCELATEHAGQATAAAEQSRVLLAQAASEINRLETENQCLQKQIQDQQSLVVELSLLRQENEELTMTVAKQSSIIDKMKKDSEQYQYKPKSPSVMRKSCKLGKENLQAVISPLRERNH
ncbi:citron Rho-interacting kinase-like [Trichoplusia ni]|uniref:Citron Rho-interacting kinase-like n=1 Tax=Trichoplusia ni TaxID=7111 RepID=A0A7E5X1D0_TRINI|nr:citron Rho-interacting kinase-like [Trichoplusia ni]